MYSFLCVCAVQEQDDDVLQEEIFKAHVVCVVYDITVEDALDRVCTCTCSIPYGLTFLMEKTYIFL